jgi:tetraether lipid synthase
MSRKNRPYQFHDTTGAICTTCLRPAEGKILLREGRVVLEKWCPAHGFERVLLADDVDWYRMAREVYVKAPELPERFATPMEFGCPYDCGLCPDHMQHSCVTVLEVTDHCNLRCPVCYADSGPERPGHRPLAVIERMLDAVVASEGEPDVVQLSGGEPTLHPDFFAILEAARARPIRHLMVNTNGLRIARDPAFADRLASHGRGLEIYLQFDALREAPLRALRGSDLREVHAQALAALEARGLSTTLVMTLVRGVNDGEVGDVIRHALGFRCVRGVTLQPVQRAGRTEGPASKADPLTVSGVRRLVVEQSGLFSPADILPVPCNPDTLAMAYALKLGGEVTPLTRHLAPEDVLAGPRNTIVFERDPALRDRLFTLFATNHSPEAQASRLADLLCCLPRLEAPGLTYENVFRVLVVQFMDASNLDVRALKKSCVHIVQPDGRMIPFETFNVFHRDGRAAVLAAIQREIREANARRAPVGAATTSHRVPPPAS